MTKRELWKRKGEIIIDGHKFLYDHFDIEFNIKFDEWLEPNMSEAKIFNLSQNTINMIKQGSSIIINAGYEGDVGLICLGKIEKVFTDWEGIDKITKITIGDGAEEWFYSTVSKTYSRGTKASTILRDIASIFGLELGDFQVANDITYQLGKSINGMLYQVLMEVVKDTGSKCYIINSRIFIRPYEKGDPTGFVLNSDTGLISSPERLEKDDFEDIPGGYIGYKVRCLLNHRINVDSIIRLDSKTVKGDFRVIEGSHSSEWITEFEVMPL